MSGVIELVQEPCVSVDVTDRDRGEIPERCPVCNGPLERVDFFGNWHVYGPADRKHLAETFGLDVADGTWVLWAGTNAACRDEACGWQWSVAMA